MPASKLAAGAAIKEMLGRESLLPHRSPFLCSDFVLELVGG